MRVQSIKENTKDYITAGTLGVIGGVSLKHGLPLSDYEKGEIFTPEVLEKLKQTEAVARKKKYYHIIANAKNEEQGVSKEVLSALKTNKENIFNNNKDEFLKNIESYDENIKSNVTELADRITQSGLKAKNIEIKDIEKAAKNSRPVSYFILMCSAILLSIAVLKNSLLENLSPKSESKPLDYSA